MEKRLSPKVIGFVIGVVLLFIGLFLFINPEQKTLRGTCLGVGCGLIGGNIAGIITDSMKKRNPATYKEYEIAEKNERNIALREKAGYITWYMTLLAICILSFVLLFLDYKIPCFLTLGLMGIHIIGYFSALLILDKKN